MLSAYLLGILSGLGFAFVARKVIPNVVAQLAAERVRSQLTEQARADLRIEEHYRRREQTRQYVGRLS